MNPSLLLAALCLGIASAAPTLDLSVDAQWNQWKAAHGKLYNESEEGWRRAVWEKNMKVIELHNWEHSQGRRNFTVAMNAFGDMTSEEFRLVMNGFQNQKHKKGDMFQEPALAEIPPSVDWRKKGCVTPVKDQVGPCPADHLLSRKEYSRKGVALHEVGGRETMRSLLFLKTVSRYSVCCQSLAIGFVE